MISNSNLNNTSLNKAGLTKQNNSMHFLHSDTRLVSNQNKTLLSKGTTKTTK